MINSKYLANYFTELFNQYGENVGKTFKIFADEGELKSSVKEYGKQRVYPTNGIVEIVSSTLTPIRDIRLNTYNAQVTLFVDLNLDGLNKDKESLNLITIRDLISNLVEGTNGTTSFVEVEGITYTQSITVGYPTTGTKTDLGYINDCLPLYLTFNIAMFEDGVNANNCKLIVNGTDIPFTRMVLTRQRTAEQDNFAGDKSTKTIMQMNGLSVDIVMPALSNNDLSAIIMQDILSGGNYALNVQIETPLASTRFIGTFGDNVASLDVATNVGYNVSIVEGVENLLDYGYNGSKWHEFKAKMDKAYVSAGNENVIVYWGDGMSEVVEAKHKISHLYDSKKTRTIRAFGDCSIEDNEYDYIITSENTVSIKAHNKSTISGDIILPNYTIIEGKTYNVTTIENNGFDLSAITSVKLPDELIQIGESAFEGCRQLTKIDINNKLTRIENYAFRQCELLTNIEIKNQVNYIGVRAFLNSGLQRAVFRNTIGWKAFYLYATIELNEDDMANPITASTFLTNTYVGYAFTTIVGG